MNIGVITLNGFFNYGNRLQAFAMQYYLKKNFPGCNVETIFFQDNDYAVKKKIINLQFIRRYIFNRHGFRDFVDKNLFLADVLKEHNFKRFTDKYIKTIYTNGFTGALNDKYDYFIIGSDQIWNPLWLKFTDIAIAHLMSKEKRIAYSASIGVDYIPEETQEQFKNTLLNTQYISVREESASAIVENFTKQKPPVLVDPTLLLERQEWLNIAQQPAWYDGQGFLLVYYLGDMPQDIQQEIASVARLNNLQIIDLMDKNNLEIYSSSPEEFVWLFKQAKIVYTDSFHGTVFSILMRRPFVVGLRNGSLDMSSRIYTLLHLFGLEQRLHNESFALNNIFQIDYSASDSILKAERDKAYRFLTQALCK